MITWDNIKTITWRLTIFPLFVVASIPILLVLQMIRFDEDFYDTKMSFLFLMELGWYGFYE